MKKVACIIVVVVGLLGASSAGAAVTPDPFFCCKMNAMPSPIHGYAKPTPIHGYRVVPRRFRMLPFHEYKLAA